MCKELGTNVSWCDMLGGVISLRCERREKSPYVGSLGIYVITFFMIKWNKFHCLENKIVNNIHNQVLTELQSHNNMGLLKGMHCVSRFAFNYNLQNNTSNIKLLECNGTNIIICILS